ncbi:MAG: transcriptional regulator, LuxR family [Actinoallomurus sp.]|nr:transcriptional regulator, LuxR family [Actinoallomurus sp.]
MSQGRRSGAWTTGPGADGDRVTGDPLGDLFEREAEIAGLSHALAAAREGAGGLVVVEGPAGIGKSRLLAAARAEANALGMVVLKARGIELERDAAFGVASELFAAPLAAASHDERAGLLAGHASLAASLLDPTIPLGEDPSALVRGLYWLTVNLATGSGVGESSGALLIEVDDAQWVDRPSLGYLAYLAARIDELPAALVVAVRSGEEAMDQGMLDWLRDRPGRRVLKPRALSPDAVDRMVLTQLPGAEPAFTRACAEVSGGNPFLARELLHTLLADGIVPTARSVSRVESLVPDSVLHSVLVRLARLGEPSQRLAEALAVLGDRAWLRQARLLAGLEAEVAEMAADALAEAHILAPGEPLRFAHPLIANAVHADIPAFARARAHRRAADLLASDGTPVESIASHLLLTRPDGDQQTVATLREAAGQTLARGDPGAAAHLLTRALEEPPALSQRGHVLLELANAEMQHGDVTAAGRVDEALPLLQAPEDRVRALAALGQLRFTSGEHQAGAEAMNEALAQLDAGDPALPPLLASYLTLNTFRASLHPIAEDRLRSVIEAARHGRPPEDPGLLAHVVLRLAFAGEPAEWVRLLAERATAADPLINPATQGILMGMVVQALCCVDELDCAERICESALAAARRRGSLLGYIMASYHRAIARYHRGELIDALADLDQAMASSREVWTAGDPWTGALQVHAHLERGELAAARDALTVTTGASPDSMDLAIALFARARLALAESEPAAALADAQAAGHILDTGFGIDHPGFVPWRRTAALAAHSLGQADRARALAGELLERARWSGTARAIGLALRTQAAISEDERRLPLLAEAVEVLKPSPSALERAHTLVELGAARRRAGQRSAAQPPLREGLQLADRMGATPLVQTARHELHATGAKPRRAAHTGADALTPTERRVAELATEGMTNPQIAQALFVTSKTIQTHLTHAYRKLGIVSRRDLPAALTRR